MIMILFFLVRPTGALTARAMEPARHGDQLRAALRLWLAGGGRPRQLTRRRVSGFSSVLASARYFCNW